MAILIALSTFSGVFRLPSEVYYACMIVSGVGFLISYRREERSFSFIDILFVLSCVASIIVNNPAPYFRSWLRLGMFFTVLLCFSNLFDSRSSVRCRKLLLNSILTICTLFSIASFVAYFFKINYFIRNDELLAYNDAGHFSGFTSHSMLLGPIASFSSIYLLTRIMTEHSKKSRIRLFASFVTCWGSVLLSASRGALLSLLAATIVCIIRLNNGHISKVLRYIIIIIAVATLTFPFWGGLAQYVTLKNIANVDSGGMFFSRDNKFAARFSEIENHIFTGVGFAAVDESMDNVNYLTGTVEPGSSWLGVFSMTGVFGFILFALIIFKALKNAYRIQNIGDSILLCGLVSFFIVHMIIEGYALAGGSILCGILWLTVGIASSKYSVTNQHEVC